MAMKPKAFATSRPLERQLSLVAFELSPDSPSPPCYLPLTLQARVRRLACYASCTSFPISTLPDDLVGWT